jgi:pyruvate formate lyase activating enzyme
MIEKIIPYTDLFLYDLKHMDSTVHKEHINVDNRAILANLEKLSKAGKEIIVRVPVIPGFNDSAGEVGAIARFAGHLGIRELHLLPYHEFGRGKYRRLGRQYLWQVKSEAQNHDLAELKEAAASEGLKVVIGG